MKVANDMPVSGRPGSQAVYRHSFHWRRGWPLLLVVLALGLVSFLGFADYLSFSEVVRNRAALRGLVVGHLGLSLILYMLLYVTVTVLLMPGAALMTVLGGFLFGWMMGGAATVLAASLGATLIFALARSSFGDILAERGGRLVKKVCEGFSKDAFSYLLFLRLVPLFPFFVVNIATAFCRVRLGTFFLATFLGILPATFAYAILGAGLDDLIQVKSSEYEACLAIHGQAGCSFDVNPASLLTPQLVLALLILGAVALVPPILRRLKAARQP